MTNDTIDYCRQIMINHILIIILCLFIVVYVVINYNLINEGNIYSGNLPKTFIITGVIFLILYIFIVWDDDDDSYTKNNYIKDNYIDNDDIVYIPKYKIANKFNIKENTTEKNKISSIKPLQEFKMDNKYNTKYIKENSSNKNENSNIFVSNKNKSKFGIKF